MTEDKKIVAIALLTAHDLERLGTGFARSYPVDNTPCFGELLAEIDAADRELWRARDREHRIMVEQTTSSRRS